MNDSNPKPEAIEANGAPAQPVSAATPGKNRPAEGAIVSSFANVAANWGDLQQKAPDVMKAILQSIAWNCCSEWSRAEARRKQRGRELSR